MNDIKFLPLTESDIDLVWQIEQKAQPSPWAYSMISNLKSRGGSHFGLFYQSQLIGYFYSQLIAGEMSLLNIVIAPKWQNQGFGKQLLTFFMQHAKEMKAQDIWLEVRASNSAAIHLYQSVGFEKVSLRTDYYYTPADPITGTKAMREDAWIMSCYLFD